MSVPAPAPTKHIFESRTFWLNVLSLLYYVLGQIHAGLPALDPNVQIIATGVLNVFLRTQTTQGVHL